MTGGHKYRGGRELPPRIPPFFFWLLGGVAMAWAAPQAQAQEQVDACVAIARAVHAVGEAENFHSRLLARTPGRRRPVEEERFVIGDVVYANSPAAGRWVKLPMTAEERRALESGLLAYPPQYCRDEGAHSLEGVATRRYSYRQTLPGANGTTTVATGQLWVADTDGRPRRYEGRHGEVSVAITFDYDRVTPPFGR